MDQFISLDFEDVPEDIKAGPKTKGKSRTGRPSIVQIEKALTGQFVILGTLLSGIDQYDGSVIVENAADMSGALIDLAKTNPRVRIVLENLMTAGAWGGVLTVIGVKVALPIAVHHSALPAPLNANLAASMGIPVKGEDAGEVN